MNPPARVVRVAGPSATVQIDGELVELPLAPRLDGGPPVAGDLVTIRREGEDGVVAGIEPRRTSLVRSAGGRRDRTIVANADLLLVVASAVDPPFRPRLVDRYLVAALVGGMDAALVVTKTDLPHDRAELDGLLGIYRAVGYPVVSGTATDPGLADAVRELIDGRIAALVGHSGVGKSTLTSALTGVERATGEVNERIGKGRHTTSDPRLIPLPGGGAVVDTAGVRAFHLPDLDPDDLAAGFPEIAAAAAGCRFRGCRHLGEDGCAVASHVSPERLDSYRRLAAGDTNGARGE